MIKREFIFWIAIWALLTLVFSSSLGSIVISFYFVTMLMPIVIATSIFFNWFLVPNFLLKERKFRFTLYFIYMLIVSAYLEILVMVLAFVILADYQIENLGTIAADIYQLTVILYLIVFVEGLFLSVRKLREKSAQIKEIQNQLDDLSQTEISIRSNRKNVMVKLLDIVYIESLGDYVNVVTTGEKITTKEKISAFEEKLPNNFVRIHRSFIINKDHVSSFNKESVSIGNQQFPIGRKYKKSSEELLRQNAIA